MEAHSKTIAPKYLYLAAGALMLIAFMVLLRISEFRAGLLMGQVAIICGMYPSTSSLQMICDKVIPILEDELNVFTPDGPHSLEVSKRQIESLRRYL